MSRMDDEDDWYSLEIKERGERLLTNKVEEVLVYGEIKTIPYIGGPITSKDININIHCYHETSINNDTAYICSRNECYKDKEMYVFAMKKYIKNHYYRKHGGVMPKSKIELTKSEREKFVKAAKVNRVIVNFLIEIFFILE